MNVKYQNSLRKEFEIDLYITSDIKYTVSYIRRNGLLLIFNWSDSDKNLIFKDLNNLKKWKAIVKGYLCIDDNNKPGSPQHKIDIVEDSIFFNYKYISLCFDLIPSETV